jgi:8-oxo-dGTP pyrophosphatase MutT (NUDIX family)
VTADELADVHKLNMWLPPGGHMETKDGLYIESPEACAKREVLEETGVRIEITGFMYPKRSGRRPTLHAPEEMHQHPFNDEHDHLGFDYFARPLKGQKLVPKGDEEGRWFSKKELKSARKGMLDGTRLPPGVLASSLRAIAAVD